ncbi:family 20 glycosylhydrolase [Actinosynnema sp. NPDC020468]|uniref:family 20 glycosylhydrolase n=1 Tax=Actinosynnema sp. NPDC020468 TaxID=3154488 RepID=UPI0033F40CDE
MWSSGSDTASAAASLQRLVPAPVSLQPDARGRHVLSASTRIYTSPAAHAVGEYLGGVLRPSTGYPLPVRNTFATPDRGIALLLGGAPRSVGDQGYQLAVTRSAVTIRANTTTGLFAGVQTLRQLLPPEIEKRDRQHVTWTVPGVRITDYPRFAHRGAMLDVARHFHPVATVKRYVDQLALYKINYLHLHLTDDQGWRLQIDGWPNLTAHGASTQVGGGPGGFYTKAQYREIVKYAAERKITVIPEVDLPGHTNAALSSYAELNCDGVAPPLRTDIEVGYSSLCVSKDVTYRFVEDVIRQLAAITPGEYLHIGGDEAKATTDADYQTFLDKVLPLVGKYGKKVVGWHEFVKTTTDTSAVPQYWGTTTTNAVVQAAAARGNKVLLSPANKAYLDMKYDASTPLGLKWAGYVEVRTAYDWNPGAYLTGVPESSVRGVEAPLWTETIVTPAHIDFMAFPRLPAIAELGWSPWSTHDWESFKVRLAAQGARWTALGIDWYHSPQIPWTSAQAEAFDQTTTTTTASTSPSGPTAPTTTTRVVGTWSAGTAYKVGDYVTYQGNRYRCLQSHTAQPGWEPSLVPVFWVPA